jgi:hypothetical protein
VKTAADHYRLRPRKSRDGWNLENDRLSHGAIWYQNETDALGYAKWNSHLSGCKIEILDERDQIVRIEEFSSGDFAY